MNLLMTFALRTSRRAIMPTAGRPAYTAYVRNLRYAALGQGKAGIEAEIPFTCQNSLGQAMSSFLSALLKENPRMTVRADDPSLPFSIAVKQYDYRARKDMEGEELATPERKIAVMGEYADQVSPIISPYFVRHIIDEYKHVTKNLSAMGGPPRAKVVNRLEIIREAASQGIALNTDLRETWGVGKPLGYGMFRNEPMWQTTPEQFRDETGYFKGKGYQPKDWDEMCAVFPPRSVRRTRA